MAQDTAEKARQKLHNIITDYLKEAFTEDEQYFDDLVPRKAPFAFLFHYYQAKLHNITWQTSSQLFTEHLPLISAKHGR